MTDVFTYGTLQAEAIWRRVTQTPRPTVAGLANGFRAARVRHADYPAMVESAGGVVGGLVYCGVPADAVARLDRFEGPQYVRRKIAVDCADGQLRWCQAYLLAPSRLDDLTDEPWTLEAFLGSLAYERFSRSYAGFPEIESS